MDGDVLSTMKFLGMTDYGMALYEKSSSDYACGCRSPVEKPRVSLQERNSFSRSTRNISKGSSSNPNHLSGGSNHGMDPTLLSLLSDDFRYLSD